MGADEVYLFSGLSLLLAVALPYALKKFAGSEELWSTVTFTVTLSVILHGISATPIMRRLDERRDPARGGLLGHRGGGRPHS